MSFGLTSSQRSPKLLLKHGHYIAYKNSLFQTILATVLVCQVGTTLDQLICFMKTPHPACPRVPGSPILRMVSWNLNIMLRWFDTPNIIWEYDWMPRDAHAVCYSLSTTKRCHSSRMFMSRSVPPRYPQAHKEQTRSYRLHGVCQTQIFACDIVPVIFQSHLR